MQPDPGQPISPAMDAGAMGAVELFARCAQDTNDSALWPELMRRYASRIKGFIRGTLRQSLPADSSLTLGGIHESDLFQSTVVRLVEDGCALMKRFSGSSESELLVYLAVITRSVVRDCLRRHRAQKRPLSESQLAFSSANRKASSDSNSTGSGCALERELLVREVRRLSLRAIETRAGEFSRRDKLIFELYFSHGLSPSQIARCEGIGLSKPGVEKALQRLKELVRSAVDNNPPFEAIT
jgi:RNA polymerase sigma factor (sigma-70 family)